MSHSSDDSLVGELLRQLQVRGAAAAGAGLTGGTTTDEFERRLRDDLQSREFPVMLSRSESYGRDILSRSCSFESRLKRLLESKQFTPVELSSWLCQGSDFSIPGKLDFSQYQDLKLPEGGLNDNNVINVMISSIDYEYPCLITGTLAYQRNSDASTADQEHIAVVHKPRFHGRMFDPRVCRSMTFKAIINDWIKPFHRLFGLDLFDERVRREYIAMLWWSEDHFSGRPLCICMRRQDGLMTGVAQTGGVDNRITLLLVPSQPFTSPTFGWR